MKTCMNILAVDWPTLAVAKATRLSWYRQGYMFSLGLSKSHRGNNPETNLDKPEVSR